MPFAIITPWMAWTWEHRFFTQSLDNVGSILLLFFSLEFFYYWYHRFSHTTRWFWNGHSPHHSPNQLNLSAAYRLGWFGRLTGSTLFFTPLVLLGFTPTVVLSALVLNLLYQFWLHADWFPRLGWLEGIFNTPSNHRVHHARNPEYLDANYGGVLVVFDRLFGTYIPERDDVPCDYGTVTPPSPRTIRWSSTSRRGSACSRTCARRARRARPGCTSSARRAGGPMARA